MHERSAPAEPIASYARAGVDIGAGERAVELMRSAVERASNTSVLTRFGAFGAAVRSPGDAMALISSADGVGTKVCLARTDDEAAGLGRDLVHHCINDILTAGARPLFFLDYLAFPKLSPERAAAIVHGMAGACAAHGCALVGGETAELPDLYREGAFDIAGFIVGSVRTDRLLDGSRIQAGDRLIGLPSTGLHTNGYTLARTLLAGRLDEPMPKAGTPESDTIRDALLAPHRCYLPEIAPLLDGDLVRGMAHITGGGLPGNVPRMLPAGLMARFEAGTWPIPPIFGVLAEYGLALDEQYKTFNMGIGMLLSVPHDRVHSVLGAVPEALPIGDVVPQQGNERVIGLW